MTIAVVRKMRSGDEHLVRQSWHMTYRESRWRRIFESEAEYHTQLRRIVDALLSSPHLGIVAVSPDDDDLILGWLLCAPPVLHYVYVKSAYRRNGIARQMVDKAKAAGPLTQTTHETFRFRAQRFGLAYRPIMSLDDVRQKESA